MKPLWKLVTFLVHVVSFYGLINYTIITNTVYGSSQELLKRWYFLQENSCDTF